jgi:hypothetical protein
MMDITLLNLDVESFICLPALQHVPLGKHAAGVALFHYKDGSDVPLDHLADGLAHGGLAVNGDNLQALAFYKRPYLH